MQTNAGVSWEAILVKIFESAATQFSMIIPRSTRAVWANKSTRYL